MGFGLSGTDYSPKHLKDPVDGHWHHYMGVEIVDIPLSIHGGGWFIGLKRATYYQ